MSDESLRILAGRLAEDVCRSYKLGRDEAVEKILVVWRADRDFCTALSAAPEPRLRRASAIRLQPLTLGPADRDCSIQLTARLHDRAR